jgi:glycosyltransferase involved in cell wall biosynthesis
LKKILFIAAHRKERSPSQRFRFEQYFNTLEQKGFKCDFSYIITEQFDRIIYSKGKYPAKAAVFFFCFCWRVKDVFRAGKYDIIFIQREAFMTGTILFEKLFSRSGAKLVFDFDDTIWLSDASPVNKRLSWLKHPEKTGEIIKICDLIIAGNAYLASYAKQFNSNVVVIPTTIDTEEYQKQGISTRDTVTIGWSGSFSTVKYFEQVVPILKTIKEQYGDKVKFALIGDEHYTNTDLDIQGIKWCKETELSELSRFDVGIMPLPDDQWSRGKCGLKGLQYMALEIPAIMSPVGMNTEIISDGVNGFLVGSDEEWVKKLSFLIDSKPLREKIGRKGRETVVARYSVSSQKDIYNRVLSELVS